jgi:hypothetical protein
MDAKLTPVEREFLATYLSSGRDRMFNVIEGFTEAQWSFKPDSETWSAAECCEHVVLVERAVLIRVRRTPEVTELPDVAGKEGALLGKKVASGKLSAPEAVQPKWRWHDGGEWRRAFEVARGARLDYAANSEDSLHLKGMPHLAFGMLDGYQWLVFLGSHCERHLRQIEAVRTCPGFPIA